MSHTSWSGLSPELVTRDGLEQDKNGTVTGHLEHIRLRCVAAAQVSLPNVDERLVDSQLYEPIPFKTAVDDGCTHVLVIRSRPDGERLEKVELHEVRLVTISDTRREVTRYSDDWPCSKA